MDGPLTPTSGHDAPEGLMNEVETSENFSFVDENDKLYSSKTGRRLTELSEPNHFLSGVVFLRHPSF